MLIYLKIYSYQNTKHMFLYSKHSIKPYKFNLLESPAYCHLTVFFYEIQATKELKSGGRIWWNVAGLDTGTKCSLVGSLCLELLFYKME